VVQSFAAEHLKTPLGEPIKGRKNKTVAELWIEKFYKKKTNLPEPIPHELVERLEQYLDVRITVFSASLLELVILHHLASALYKIDIAIKLLT
jgi:hypothetical protein